NGGSPSTVKYNAGRSGVASWNMIWCASVVLPLPGGPAMRLEEDSGRPPPSTSSRPGTPVCRRLKIALPLVIVGVLGGIGGSPSVYVRLPTTTGLYDCAHKCDIGPTHELLLPLRQAGRTYRPRRGPPAAPRLHGLR